MTYSSSFYHVSKVTVTLFTTIVFLITAATRVNGNVCLMVYFNADNEWESYLRQDLLELIQSPAIKDSTLTTWAYFDSRNYNYLDDIDTPLPQVYYTDGSVVTGDKFQGSLYLTFNHTLSKMISYYATNVVSDDTIFGDTFFTELDSDHPDTVFEFLRTALPDCVSRFSTEYFLLFSGHGFGFGGFGYDENVEDDGYRRRRLVQRNQALTSSIQMALQNVSGAPDKLDVLGFDAPQMGDFGALDEYRNVTNMYLACEASVSVGGFAYSKLDSVESATEMAKTLYRSFVEEAVEEVADFGLGRTVALIDTGKYTTFLTEWEKLASQMKNLLDAGDDPNYVTILSRARAESLSYEGLGDVGVSIPSMVDIGNFFAVFRYLCNVQSTNELSDLLSAAETAYNSMFIARGGSGPGTGMVIHWPYRLDYLFDAALYDNLLFNTSGPFATTVAPKWLDFLQSYYGSNTATEPKTTSVCTESVISAIEPKDENDLLLNPKIEEDTATDTVVWSSDISYVADITTFQYGVDLTKLANSGSRKLLQKKANAAGPKGDDAHSYSKLGRNRRPYYNRHLQDVDYYLQYGGNSFVNMDGPVASARWNKTFFFLSLEDDTFELLYVNDKGNGELSFPVCYFPPESTIFSTSLEGIVELADAIETLGCMEGELIFRSSEGETELLYVFELSSIVPKASGGQISPIAQFLYSEYTTLVGGQHETILDWTTESTPLQIDEVSESDMASSLLGYNRIYLHATSIDIETADYNDISQEATGIEVYLEAYRVPVRSGQTSTSTSYLTSRYCAASIFLFTVLLL